MQDLFIEFLPPWVETNLQPAFYDAESGTVLQQTARMYAKINDIIKIVNSITNYDEEIAELKRQMQALIVGNEQFKHDIQDSIDYQLNEFMIEVFNLFNSEIAGLKAYTNKEVNDLKEYVDESILGKIIVYNPVTGLQDQIGNVINSIYDISRTGAITASEYDSLELTATEYDGKEITAYDYDINGKSILTN